LSFLIPLPPRTSPTPQLRPNHTKKLGDEPLPSSEGCGLNYKHPGFRRMDRHRTCPSPFQRDVGGHILARQGNWGRENIREDPLNRRPVQCFPKTGYEKCHSPFSLLTFSPNPHSNHTNPQHLPPTSLPRWTTRRRNAGIDKPPTGDTTMRRRTRRGRRNDEEKVVEMMRRAGEMTWRTGETARRNEEEEEGGATKRRTGEMRRRRMDGRDEEEGGEQRKGGRLR